jgi:uncharacterized protein
MKSLSRIFLVGVLLATPLSAAEPIPAGPAGKIIGHLRMAKIPGEGCWFAVTYESTDRIPAGGLPARYGSSRLAGTAIYALLTREDFSAMHRLKTDEIWHFYAGDPIELLLLHPDGRGETVVLGSDLLAGQHPQHTVKVGVWMGARPLPAKPDAYSLFGCTLAPGFDYADYEPGYRDDLQAKFPAQSEPIAQLTRAEFLQKPAAEPAPPAPASPVVFTPATIPEITVAPGVTLRELIGRVAAARSTDYSIARFALAPGKTTGVSYNKIGEEVFLIISGQGTAVVGSESTPVAAGSVVVMKPGMHHSLTAHAGESLEFYAITFPAFSPADYVRVE